MRGLVFLVSVLLALAGMAMAITGVSAGEGKPVAIGFVLLAGGGTFALVHIGLRPVRGPAAPSESPQPHESVSSRDG